MLKALATLGLAGLATASPKVSVQFGLYDADLAPDGGWKLMDADDWVKHRGTFIKSYNSNEGIDVIAPFKTKNCCMAIAGGKKLTLKGSQYGMQFPAATTGGIRCNPTAGYTEARYQLYKAPKLAADAQFGSKAGCATGHNPGIFMRQITSVETTLTDGAPGAIIFGMFDLERPPAGGWMLMSSADFNEHKSAFVSAYNANGGFSLIKSFQSGNCCIAVKGGNKLTIKGSPYGYQFPASSAGGIRCNPKGGYAEAVYQFYRSPELKANVKFGEKSACSTDHNPAVYMLQKAAAADVEFGLFDAQVAPGNGWQLMSAADMTAYKSEFVNEYNAKGGIAVIKKFESGNCCIALRRGLKLTITGTAYGYQFPAAASGGIRCNPTGGYADAVYRFYKAEKLTMKHAFGEKAACTIDHNPGLYFRGATAVTADAWTPTGTEAPTQVVTVTPVHCDVTNWSSWSSCSARCGAGVKFRVRSVSTIDQNGGDKCPPLREDAKCVEQDCPVHCEVGAWDPNPTPCNAKCGGGFRTYTRTVTKKPNMSGDKCPHLSKQEKCNTKPCKVHCELSEWSGWEECNAACGGGQERRVRKILVGPQWGGDACDTLMDVRACNTHACPVHCTVSEWSVWSDCSQKCGTGSQERMRLVTRASSDGGSSCPPLGETRPCNTAPCPIDCAQTGWTAYSTCSKSCGKGMQTKTNRILIEPKHGGKACTATSKTRDCMDTPCAVDCIEGKWDAWSDCDATCGWGYQTRVRVGDVPANKHGTCSAAKETRSCKIKECAVHCALFAWGSWSKCSDDCGGGHMTRTRAVSTAALHGGDNCPVDKCDNCVINTPLVQKKTCNNKLCPIDCVASEWGGWNSCSRSCGGGTQQRVRHIKVRQAHGGKECPSLVELQACNDHVSCPVDCVVSPWPLNFSPCSAKCGEGTQSRSRKHVRPKFGGKKCPAWTQTQRCNNGPCAVHCETSEWGKWTGEFFDGHGNPCNRKCGPGETLRHRTITKEARHGGDICPSLVEKKKCELVACPVDCIMNDFGPWSECSHDCGGGTRKRYRTVARNAAHGGKPCPPKKETRTCNAGPCAIHCTVSRWTDWTTCSKTCGGGHTSRTRHITKQAQYGGFICPNLKEHQECGMKPCPVDCKVSGTWSGWSVCSTFQQCGPGKQTRTKSIVTAAQHGGKPCVAQLVEQKACLVRECSVDCEVSPWNKWSACSKTCGIGERWRRRKVKRAAMHGGMECPHLAETEKCSNKVCPIDCQVSLWDNENKAACSRSCGGGHMIVSRKVTVVPEHGGKSCPSLTQHRKCNTHECPRDCQVTAWSVYTDCDAKCMGGKKTRTRTITHDASHGGKPCPTLLQTTDCNSGNCAVDCDVSSWGTWSLCTTTCGKGAHWRERTITRISRWAGHECPVLKEEGECEERKCPVNCQVSEWSDWTACNASCGGGVMKRKRSVLHGARHGGIACPASQESKPCNQEGCPLDCKITPWSAWSECSESCGYGLRSRSRAVLQHPEFGGKTCPGVSQTAECNESLCPIHCSVSSWSPWGRCTKSCGNGVQSRTRVVVRHAHHGGYQCPKLSDRQACNLRRCPVHCEMTEWTGWSACSKSCNYGVQRRTRAIKSPLKGPAYGGKACPHMWEEKPCASWKCAVHCKVSDWTAWGGCSATCGEGTKTRTRKILVIPQWKGHVCPALEEQTTCKLKSCKVDCDYFAWGIWSKCSKSCGAGMKTRSRSVRTPARFGGKKCGPALQHHSCNVGKCPVHCEVGSWSAWSTCTKKCGKGTLSRSRKVTQEKKHGGDVCPSLTEERECMLRACPVNCKVRPWSYYPSDIGWSSCSQTCGGGVRKRTRPIIEPERFGGTCKEQLTYVQRCNTKPCPVDCQLGDWGPWSGCSVSCKTGTKTRTKVVLRRAAFGGRQCKDAQTTEKVHCNAGPCPVGCETSPWGSWGACSETCGVGSKTRSRSVLTEATNGGAVCPMLKQVGSCMRKLCPVDCVVTEFSGWSTCSVSCGTGTQTRSKRVTTDRVGAGKACPKNMVQTSTCRRPACVTTTRAPQATTTRAPTSAGTFSTEAAWDKVDHSRTTRGSHAPTNGVAPKRAVGKWAATTKAPTVAANIDDRHTHCANGDEQVPEGWKGAGATAATYCNRCTCTKGHAKVQCTKRKCGTAVVNDVTGWGKCDKVACTASQTTHGAKPHWVIAVQHSHAEHMKKHVCTFNKYSKQCKCKCKTPYKAYTKKAQHGAFNFGTLATSKCNTIHFKHPYNPARGAVHVSASASYSAGAANNAAHVWVQSTTHDRFTLCARSPFAYRHEEAAGTAFVGQYYAFQGALKDSRGKHWASHGTAVVKGLDASKAPCQTIAFGKTYDRAPMVIGTIDFNGSKIQQQLTSWVENVNAEQFRVCFHNEGQLAAAKSAKPRYNWIAFEHANPSLWNKGSLPYSMGGRVAAGAWSKYAGTWHEASKFGTATWDACQTVEFGKTFASAPTVLVTANHEDSTSMDWSTKPHPETQTWVDAVGTSSFKVCSTERAPISGDRDNSLKWDWIAFGEDSIAVAA